MTNSSPSRWQLVKLGLVTCANALLISLILFVPIGLVTLPIVMGDTARNALAKCVALVLCACVFPAAHWQMLRRRLVQRFDPSTDQQQREVELRVHFWAYVAGWMPMLIVLNAGLFWKLRS